MVKHKRAYSHSTIVDPVDVHSAEALRVAVETPVRPDDMRQALEVFAEAALGGSFKPPAGYKFVLSKTPLNVGLVAVLMRFSQKGWHGDNITAMGMRVRGVMGALTEFDWIAVNLFRMSEDHKTFHFDQRLIQAAAATRMTFDPVSQTSTFHRQDFLNRTMYLLSASSGA